MGRVKEVLINYVDNILKEARESFKGDELLELECEIINSHLEKSTPMTREQERAILEGETKITFSDVLNHFTESGYLILPSIEVMEQMNQEVFDENLYDEVKEFFNELQLKGDLYKNLVEGISKKLNE